MEEKKDTAEGSNLNGGEEAKKDTFTAEEVEAMKKEMQSNSEKGVQKLIAEKKEVERVAAELPKAIGKVAEDKAYLVQLNDSDPKLAKIILDSYYDGMDIDAYKTSIDFKEDLSDPEVYRKKLESEAKRLADARDIERAKEAFVSEMKMDDDEKSKFEEAFSERTQLKTFKADDVRKHLEKAYREITPDTDSKDMKVKEAAAKAMATGDGKSGGSGNEKPAINQEVAEFLAKYS